MRKEWALRRVPLLKIAGIFVHSPSQIHCTSSTGLGPRRITSLLAVIKLYQYSTILVSCLKAPEIWRIAFTPSPQADFGCRSRCGAIDREPVVERQKITVTASSQISFDKVYGVKARAVHFPLVFSLASKAKQTSLEIFFKIKVPSYEEGKIYWKIKQGVWANRRSEDR